jgi:hypothetical protein
MRTFHIVVFVLLVPVLFAATSLSQPPPPAAQNPRTGVSGDHENSKYNLL